MMSHDGDRRLLIILLVIIATVVFFFPKECGIAGFPDYGVFNRRMCSCLGLKYDEGYPILYDMRTPGSMCFGICHSCECTQKDPVSGVVESCNDKVMCYPESTSELRFSYGVQLDVVKRLMPESLAGYADSGSVDACVDYGNPNMNQGEAMVCMACGVCGTESPIFWKFDLDGEVLEAHVWDIQCEGTKVEYRTQNQGEKQGIMVDVPLEDIPKIL